MVLLLQLVLLISQLLILIRAFSLLTRGFELVTREIELVSQGCKLVTCKFELVTCIWTPISQFASRVYFSTSPEVFHIKSGLKNFTKFTWKPVCRSLCFNQVAVLKLLLGAIIFPITLAVFSSFFLEFFSVLDLLSQRREREMTYDKC